jgi:hypothetical protein
MRNAAALTLVVAALGSAAYFGSVRLDAHGNYPICLEYQGGLLRPACAPSTRAGWQLPVAVAIAAFGVLGAIGVLTRAQTKPGRSGG